MLKRRFVVSVLFGLLASCGGDEASTPSNASGASGTGAAGAQTVAPSAGRSGLPVAVAGTSGSAGAPSAAAGNGGGAGAPSGPPTTAAGNGGSAGAPVTAAGSGGSAGIPVAAAGSGGSAGAPESCPTVNLTYTDFAAPFFASHCNRCHGQGDKVPRIQRPPVSVTFNSEADVMRLRDRIRKIAITDQRMPPGEPLSACVSDQLSKYLETLPAPPPEQ